MLRSCSSPADAAQVSSRHTVRSSPVPQLSEQSHLPGIDKQRPHSRETSISTVAYENRGCIAASPCLRNGRGRYLSNGNCWLILTALHTSIGCVVDSTFVMLKALAPAPR